MQVFISHASQDSALAQKVASTLKEEGFQVWDGTQILLGDNWAESLAKALNESNAMVVLITPNSVNSPYIEKEISYALGNKAYKNRLIPVIAAPSKQIEANELPWILRKLHLIRISHPYKDKEGFREIARVLQPCKIP